MYCNKNYQQKFNEKLKETFFNIYQFSNHGNNLVYFIVAKRCLYIWIYGWLGKIYWNIITLKKYFYSHLNLKDITDEDFAHKKRACKDFEIKNLGEYHDLHVQKNTQSANISPQDFPRLSPSNVPRTSTKDPIWPSRERPDLTFSERSAMTSTERPNMMLKGCHCEFDAGLHQDFLRTSPRGPSKHLLGTMWGPQLEVLKFLFHFL